MRDAEERRGDGPYRATPAFATRRSGTSGVKGPFLLDLAAGAMQGGITLVHFADLHLDAAFSWMGRGGRAAGRRRQALREALERILALARDVDAAAVLCAGDLYEQARVSADTAAFVRASFARIHPRPVFIAPGNHDWWGPGTPYRDIDWSANVHVFSEDRLRPVPLAPGWTLWGAAHRRPAGTGGFLEGFRAEGPGRHLALFHGAEETVGRPGRGGSSMHAPFRAEQIPRAGLAHAFLGHYHVPRAAPRHTYPGNPEPLSFGERGERGAVVASLSLEGGVVERRAVRLGSTVAHDLEVDLSGCSDRQDVVRRLRLALRGRTGIARLTLSGEVHPEVDLTGIDAESLGEDRLEGLNLRIGDIRVRYDLEVLALERGVRGQFVRDVQAADLPGDLRRRVLVTGLRALDGRDDLEVAADAL